MTEAPFTFTYWGVIKPKERPRMGKHGQFYTPKGTRDSEDDIRACILERLDGKRPDTSGRFGVAIELVGQPGDIDNLGKTLLDAGQGLLWDNDEQVDYMETQRAMGPTSWVKVTVRRLEETP